jgi:hypothetical protein
MDMTIRIPARAAGTDARVELYKWVDGKMPAKPEATATIPAADLDPGGALDPDAVQQLFLDRKGEEDRFAVDGQRLFEAIFGGALASAWTAIAKAAQKKLSVRVYLAIEDPALARLPWELMAPVGEVPLFLRRNPLFLRWRSPEVVDGDAPPPEPWPINVLVVVGCDKEQATTIGVDDELAAIRRSLRAVDHLFDFDVLDARTTVCNRKTFRARIEKFQPHILHFIGHASSEGSVAALELWDSNADDWDRWPAGDLTIMLQQLAPDIRVAYLNACRTHTEDGKPAAASSIAEAFLRANVPAVIAMQADVHGDAANISAVHFYERLAAGDTIDVAVEAGRVRILDRADLGPNTRHPYCPVLTIQCAPEAILRYSPRVTDAERRDAIENCSTLAPVRRRFVDQAVLRRDLIGTLFTAPSGKERSAAVFHGAKHAGKSWLGKWLLAVSAFRNYGVRYVQARHYPDWLALMRAVISEQRFGHYVNQPLPQKAQDYFYWTLNHVAAGQPVPPGDPPSPVADQKYPLTSAIANDNDAISKVMQAFVGALKIAAGDDGFLLVVDSWHKSGDHAAAAVTIKDLKANLWDRIAENHKSPVKLLLILPPANADAAVLTADYPKAHWHQIGFEQKPGEDMPELLLELYRVMYNEDPSPDEMQAIAIIKTPALPKGWVNRCRFIRHDVGGHAIAAAEAVEYEDDDEG